MTETFQKIGYYIAIPCVLTGGLIGVLYWKLGDFEKATQLSSGIIQSTAIIAGGIWAYHKFGWEKKCENIITLKASLIEYSFRHSMSAMEYRKDTDILKYKLRIFNDYEQIRKKLHLSYYLPRALRDKIFETIWLTVGNDHDHIDENWKKFGKQLEEIYEEFENILSK